MEVDSTVSQILEQAADGQEIILEHDGGSDDGDIEEIVEIIEEIEEVEEYEEPDEAQEKVLYAQEEVPDDINEKNNSQVCYDASADWGDEEAEQERLAQNSEPPTTDHEECNTYVMYNNGENSQMIGVVVDNGENFETNHEQDKDNLLSDSQHQIVQNSENNLVYTVLGSKKQVVAVQDHSNVEFVEVQRYRNDDLPEDGTIYYAVNEEEGTYVQATQDNEQQYQYASEEPMEQENQEWEGPDELSQQQQEQTEQDQIYLHEDEDGQLYFKNEQGKLQQVYLTPDGNYAIAENSSDEQDSQEDSNQAQEDPADAENYVVPDLDLKQFNTKKKRNQVQDVDDDTVTISLIISEDEHGQKRTQVIIPSPAEPRCDICNKSFKTSLQLLKHNRLKHAREEDITTRNFPCDLCPKRFSDQNSLARHRKVHTEARPFQCLECHKSFPTANTLRKHLTSHDPDSEPLPCIYCGRRFLDKTSLMKHEQSHLGGESRTNVCDICQKCFPNSTELSIHRKNHDPDRKFDCEVCGREFNRLNNLQRHMLVHQQQQGQSEEVLSCNVCGITYKFSSSLTRHMVTTHMNPEKLRQQAEEQRKKREDNYRRYLENRKTYETQQPKRPYRRSGERLMDDQDDYDDEAD
ncbi:hypothetical protein QAD02_017310 [Eretmocerus hayati]|uniref:Uncharacterized protein n=1 Tax=Eretmocerus hayati TaxID=131215 RepID=A0ACC2PDH6_9HYME|nr:hypothetical protein QAD02_017310 [Eretmocerus hayati]